jgi:hypothetical protein
MAEKQLSQRSIIPTRHPPDQPIIVHQTPIALRRRSVHDSRPSSPPPSRGRHNQDLDLSGIHRHCSPLPGAL